MLTACTFIQFTADATGWQRLLLGLSHHVEVPVMIIFQKGVPLNPVIIVVPPMFYKTLSLSVFTVGSQR